MSLSIAGKLEGVGNVQEPDALVLSRDESQCDDRVHGWPTARSSIGGRPPARIVLQHLHWHRDITICSIYLAGVVHCFHLDLLHAKRMLPPSFSRALHY